MLIVSSTHISAETQAELYHFSNDEKAQLTELTSDKYDDLWIELIGATGDVIQTNSSHVPKGIFTWPLQEDSYISSPFGYRYDPISGEYKYHSGIDIPAGYGTPILAAADGEVVTASYMEGGYGYYVKIKHNDTYSTLYGHASVLLVSVGQTVKQGQVIAQVGSTGYSTGNHLHFEVYMLGTRVNAMGFFS